MWEKKQSHDKVMRIIKKLPDIKLTSHAIILFRNILHTTVFLYDQFPTQYQRRDRTEQQIIRGKC